MMIPNRIWKNWLDTLITEVDKFHDLGNLQIKDCIFRINGRPFF